MNLIQETFNFDKKKLPTIKEIKSVIDIDCDDWTEKYNHNKNINTFKVRNEYVKNNFSILCHEFFISFDHMISDLNLKNISELHSGIGWFTLWLKKYNIPISNCIDNMTWKYFKNRYLKHVEKKDSIEFVKNNSNIEMFILSWPYMDNTAYNVWKAMKKGQYLFYIGEDCGGCTANDNFFKAVEKKEVEDIWSLNKNFISFWGIYDRPFLYR